MKINTTIFKSLLRSGKAVPYALPDGLGELEICPRDCLLEDIDAGKSRIGMICDLKYMGENVLTISDNWDMKDLHNLVREWMPVILRIRDEKTRTTKGEPDHE